MNIPIREQPAGRVFYEGPANVSGAELISAILGEKSTRIGEELLDLSGGIRGLSKLTVDRLQNISGIGIGRTSQIFAAIELGKRIAYALPDSRELITSPAKLANLAMAELKDADHEELWVVLLSTRGHVISTVKLYRGSLNTTMIRVGEIFKDAIRRNAAQIAIIHNHPSGDPSPSPEDLTLTRLVVEAGNLLGIQVLDHIVIGDNRYVSLKERGLF